MTGTVSDNKHAQPVRSAYLSGRFERRKEINVYRLELEAAGIAVISSWLTDPAPPELNENAPGFLDPVWTELARLDRDEVGRADVFVLFADPQGGAGGSRHVEFGMALAWGKRIIVVGEVENLFQRLPEVTVCACWEAALCLLLDVDALSARD